MPNRFCGRRAPRRKHLRVGLLGLALTTAVSLAPVAAFASDPEVPKQWALTRIGAPAAWDASVGSGVLVGIVDSGVDLGHQEFAGRIVASANCLGADHDPSRCTGTGQDDNGHGTHVAGIIAASNNNGVGIAGVAPGARLLVAKAIDAQSGGVIGDIDAAVKWVVDRGAKVVNLSLSEANPLLSSALGSELAASIEYAWSHGAVPVVAAGNQNVLGLLGSYGFGNVNALIVGATGPDDKVASYSSPLGNAKWALLAPGGTNNGALTNDIYSTLWESGRQNHYGYRAGTSMATPHVAATVALLLARGYTPQQAVDRVLATVDPMSCGGSSGSCRGRLNSAAAVGPAPAPQPPPLSPPPPGAASTGPGGATASPGPSPAPAAQAASKPTSTSRRAAARVPAAQPPPSPPPAPAPSEPAPPSPSPSPSPSSSRSTEAPRLAAPVAAAGPGGGRAFPSTFVLALGGAQLGLLGAALGLRHRRRAQRSGI